MKGDVLCEVPDSFALYELALVDLKNRKFKPRSSQCSFHQYGSASFVESVQNLRVDLPFIKICSWTIETELAQLRDEERDTPALTREAYSLIGQDFSDPTVKAEAELWLLRAHGEPERSTSAWIEPSHWEEVLRECGGATQGRAAYGQSELESRIKGAWLGLAAGSRMGGLVRGLSRDEAWPLFKEAGLWPLDRIPHRGDFDPARLDALRRSRPGRLSMLFGETEEETGSLAADFALICLAALEEQGSQLDSTFLAKSWLCHLPILAVPGAERAAYRNLLNGFLPPESAVHFNPCREWCGSLHRASIHGWVAPGDPLLAARSAFADAEISHTKNGVYSALWLAGMNAAAFTAGSIDEILAAALRLVPRQSRLFSALNRVAAWHADGQSHDDFLERLHGEWNEKLDRDRFHAIANSQIILAALLWGEGDFRKSVGLAALSLLESAGNAAAVGGVIGAWRGEDGLPSDYLLPLERPDVRIMHWEDRPSFDDLTEKCLSVIHTLSLR